MTTITFYRIALLLIASLHMVCSQGIINCSTKCFAHTQTAKTVYEFWQEINQGCEIDANNFFRIRKKISRYSAKQNVIDKTTNLLHNHVGSTLMKSLFNQLIAAISTKTLNTKPELEEMINELYKNEQDKSFALKIWQTVLDESSLFMSEEDILEQIFLLTNGDLKLNLFEYLIKKFESQTKSNPKVLPLLTFGITTVLKQRQQTKAPVGDPSIGRLLSKLPQQLLTIYQSWNYKVFLKNNFYKEYALSHLENGPSPNKRYLFTFLVGKNYFGLRGFFSLQFNAKGLLAIGASYSKTYKYLTAEESGASICLDCGIDAAQWWQVLWPISDATQMDQQVVLFQNVVTQELLCTTNTIFNQSLVIISTLEFKKHLTDSQCQWTVFRRD